MRRSMFLVGSWALMGDVMISTSSGFCQSQFEKRFLSTGTCIKGIRYWNLCRKTGVRQCWASASGAVKC